MKLFKRENYLKRIRPFYHATDLIKVITGVRGCGKRTLMELISLELKESGVKEDNIIFLNLDKRGFKSIKTGEQLDKLLTPLCKIEGTKYLFINELVNVKNFEPVLNAYREENDFSIFITGSNSYLLSGELITKLTGRYLEFEMFPLSFEEYILMKKFYNLEINTDLFTELNNYINEGGFPRTIFLPTLEAKRDYVLGVVEEILEKDVYKRVKITNRESFNVFKNFIINNFGNTFSLIKVYNSLNESGHNLSKQTITRYIKILVQAKVLNECDRFDLKSRKALSGEKKYYLSDLSFMFLTNPDSRINYGPVLENIIYVYAKSKQYQVTIGKIGKLECDFILKDPNLNYAYAQVSYSILASEETEDREYKPLEMIRDNYPKYVLTTDKLIQRRNGIKHVNLMDFMVEGKMFE